MKSKGFTLIELAIVIVILGILAAVAIPRFADMATEAKKAQRQAIANNLKAAYAIYLVKNGGTPPNWTQLQGYLQDAPAQLKLTTTGGNVYMDYDNNNTMAATGEKVATLYSDEACATAVANATTPIRCIRSDVN